LKKSRLPIFPTCCELKVFSIRIPFQQIFYL
jgi:hypothetical protein